MTVTLPAVPDSGTPEFLARYPEYSTTARLDELRTTEYAHLDRDGGVYLDYTGAGVPAAAQLAEHARRLSERCYGNPHSNNPTARASDERVASARRAVLAHLNASPEDYTVIFTANATAACRLVGEAYPFGRGRRLVLTFDNHNSVNGIRQFARDRGARVRYVPLEPGELRVEERDLIAALRRGGRALTRRGLFAFPAQSNFTGVRHPLRWVDLAHGYGYDVLLDAAAYLPTGRLDLTAVPADFVCVSWYKLFGYPTGLGCLVARRDALARLRRPWFAGGTIVAVSVQPNWHRLLDSESAFEDGTLNFLSIPDVEFGLSFLDSVGVDVIARRVGCLTGWLLHRLLQMRHSNGAPIARVYGPADLRDRGATVTFNFLDPDGGLVDERLVARETAEAGFSLRTGCFCNPGAGEGAFGIGRRRLRGSMGWGVRTVDEYLTLIGLATGGAVRASFGLASTFPDVERFLAFAERTYRDRRADTTGLPPRLVC
ncbi:aminotransferase class V-fold PLP-dependent enzyme [Rugosimonospora africana]|uniref:Aminotransferase class V-fold PLP-dependent enzyme n=1 Tax=Rugosimonospora africana TaxID=556532 RepID=A0A8J3VVX5_9ACTN|nr:aminotransferase class V-fold PLP-dependent enzyme [Rugosimonospora africana]GIH20364.1 aminotransferase class V-fold PLP-dependent enzyme [Rugosimonospora africana]